MTSPDEWYTQQAKQQLLWYDKHQLDDAACRIETNNLLLSLNEEVGEFQRLMYHQKHATFYAPERQQVAYAIIDVIKMLYAIGDICDVPWETINTAWHDVYDHVESATHERFQIAAKQKVIAVDIDDTIADYSTTYQTWLNEHDMGDMESNRRQFRNTIHFMELPAIHGAASALKQASKGGWAVMYVTSRPKSSMFVARTRAWLRKNGFPVHGLFFNRDKPEAIAAVYSGTAVVIDDRMKHIQECAAAHYRTIWYRGDQLMSNGTMVMNNWSELDMLLKNIVAAGDQQ